MTVPSFEKKPQPWHCDSCGAVNYSTRYKRCAACWSPAPVVRERQSATRRTMLISGLVTGVAFLGSGGFWVASSLLSRRSQLQPGQAVQAMWEVLLDPGSTLSGEGDFVAPAIAWSPDGTKIACTAMFGKPINKGVMVVDAKTAQTKWTHQEAQVSFDAIVWSPDGRQLALAGSGGSRLAPFIQIWQVQGWQKVTEYPLAKSGACGHLVWSPDGTRLAGFNSSDLQVPQFVQIWKASDGEVLFRQEAMGQDLFLSWLPNSHALATSWWLGELDIWNADTGENLLHRDREPDVPSASDSIGRNLGFNFPPFLVGPDAALAPNGQRVAFYAMEQSQFVILVWDLRTASRFSQNDTVIPSRLFSCQPVAGQHWGLTWSPNGTYLAACQSNSSPASIRFWNASTGKLAFSYEAVSFPHQLTWSPNGRFLAVVDNQPTFLTLPRDPGRNFVLRVLEVR